jgi:hypothetical protein
MVNGQATATGAHSTQGSYAYLYMQHRAKGRYINALHQAQKDMPKRHGRGRGSFLFFT